MRQELKREYFKDPDVPTETFRDLEIQRIDKAGKILVKIWRGKQARPYAYIIFTSADRRENYIREQKEGELARIQMQEDRKRDRAERKIKALEQIQAGTILHNSWGYDQTNCDFYQVIERHGSRVTVRKIAGETVEGSEQGMSCSLRPCRDQFIGKPIVKMITASGVQFECGWTSVVEDEKQAFSCSWYA